MILGERIVSSCVYVRSQFRPIVVECQCCEETWLAEFAAHREHVQQPRFPILLGSGDAVWNVHADARSGILSFMFAFEFVSHVACSFGSRGLLIESDGMIVTCDATFHAPVEVEE